MKLCRIIAAIFWFCSPIFAQSQISSGVIQGVVRDVTGGVLPETLIMARHLGIGITLVVLPPKEFSQSPNSR